MVVNLLVVGLVNATRPMVSYRALTLGGGGFEVGLIASAFSFFSMLGALPIGRWVDRWGEVRFLVFGSLLLAAGCAWAAIGGSLLELGLSQAVVGCGWIVVAVALQALLANEARPGDRDGLFAWYSSGSALGQLAGPALAAAIVGGGAATAGGAAAVPTASLALVFIISAAGTALAGAIGWTLRDSSADQRAAALAAAPNDGMLRAGARVLVRPGMPGAMFVSITVISCVDLLIAYLPLYGDARGLSVEAVGALLSIRAAASLVSRLFMPRLIVMLGRVPLLVGTMVLAAVGLALVPFTSDTVTLVVLMVVSGLGLGIGQPLTIAWVADRTPLAERATALAVRLAGNRGALFVLPTVMGALASTAGVAPVFWVLAALLGAAPAWQPAVASIATSPSPHLRPAPPDSRRRSAAARSSGAVSHGWHLAGKSRTGRASHGGRRGRDPCGQLGPARQQGRLRPPRAAPWHP